MARRERGSGYDLDTHDDALDGSHGDTHDLLFGADEDGVDDTELADENDRVDDPSAGGDSADAPERFRPRPSAPRPGSRLEARRATRSRRSRRAVAFVAVLLVAVLGVAVYVIGLPVYRYLYPSDYDGSGSGNVIVTIRPNDGASEIGETLTKADVVGSKRAFTEAASDDDRSANIQPGSYKLRHHMSAGSALNLLLNPAAKVDSGTLVTEGSTIADVEKRLAAPPCTSTGGSEAGCGLGVSAAQITKALTNVQSLGIPTDYLPSGRNPTSVEGFLFPATYTFDGDTTVTDALQQMVGKFTDQARVTKFSTRAKAVGLTPYQALIIASIAQAEAKFPEDYAKVARVILNRLAIRKPLQVDATSAYAAKLKGLDPTEEIYAQTQGPFNTYKNAALPPTPIGNPGEQAMNGAVTPTQGTWIYYVNRDAAGHLGFYTKESDFIKAATKCAAAGWGCAAP